MMDAPNATPGDSVQKKFIIKQSIRYVSYIVATQSMKPKLRPYPAWKPYPRGKEPLEGLV